MGEIALRFRLSAWPLLPANFQKNSAVGPEPGGGLFQQPPDEFQAILTAVTARVDGA